MSAVLWVRGSASCYAPLSAASTLSELTGRTPRTGRAAGAGASLLGAAVASYTAALIADTAVPAWHEGRRELPYVFIGSAASAAGGFGVLCAPRHESVPAWRMALTRFGLFAAGTQSARDPRYTVAPQRQRRAGAGAAGARN